MRPHALAIALLAATTAAAAAAAAADPLFPSLRAVGDELYTGARLLAGNKTAALTAADPVKAKASDASHAVTNAASDAKAPLGNVTMAAFHAIDDAEYAKWVASGGTCDPAARKPLPYENYAFLGSGLLLPYYQGVVAALQDRGVLTKDVMASAKFSGLSGGSFTAVLTGLGMPGAAQYAIFKEIAAAIETCKAGYPNDSAEAALVCTLHDVGVPILEAAIQAAYPDAAATIKGRVTIWACQVDALSTSLAHSVPLGTWAWSGVPDIVSNIKASSAIPCFSRDAFYSSFRGAPFIDGGYCSDLSTICSASLDKCMKVGTAFLGPNLRGTAVPTPPGVGSTACPYLVPPNLLPNPGKPYFTPADTSLWTLPSGSCRSPADIAAVGAKTTPFVAQGVTAKPDIHPTFYAPLPALFADGCQWLQSGLSEPPGGVAGLDAIYQHGYDSAAGWADAHGYCA